ncbi:MAG: RNA methyltransferase [Bacteroidota bacterium]
MMLSKNESKFIKSLKLKKYRQQERGFLVEGEKNVEEVLQSNLQIHSLVGTPEFLERLDPKYVVGHETRTVKQSQLESLGTLKSNQSALAVVRMPIVEGEENQQDHIIALDSVSDPGNLGTIIRTMDWFGYRTLLCSEGTADFYNPKAIAATMGSFTRVFPHYVDLPDKLRILKASGLNIYGLVLDGAPLTVGPLGPGVYVLGSESHGISSDVLRLLDHRLTISSSGRAESLNVAIASAILLHELRRP